MALEGGQVSPRAVLHDEEPYFASLKRIYKLPREKGRIILAWNSCDFAGCTMGRAYARKSEPMHRQQLRRHRRFSQPDHVLVMSEEEHLAAFGHAAQNTHGRKRPCIVEVQKKIVGHEG